jgi:hypothetical protein
MPVVIWGGRIVAGWLVTKALGSVADTAEAGAKTADAIAKAAPWIVAGAAVWMMTQRGR